MRFGFEIERSEDIYRLGIIVDELEESCLYLSEGEVEALISGLQESVGGKKLTEVAVA